MPLCSRVPAQRMHGCAVKCIRGLIRLKENFAKKQKGKLWKNRLYFNGIISWCCSQHYLEGSWAWHIWESVPGAVDSWCCSRKKGFVSWGLPIVRREKRYAQRGPANIAKWTVCWNTPALLRVLSQTHGNISTGHEAQFLSFPFLS